jgi:hypothetical protein
VITKNATEPIAPSVIDLSDTGDGSGGGSSMFTDAYYDLEDFNDINIFSSGAGTRNTDMSNNVVFAPWEAGHEGILKMTCGTSNGQNSTLLRNFGNTNQTALDLTKVAKLIYRAVIKIDSLNTSYAGGGEHTWGILSNTSPVCGAMFSVAPGFTGTDSVVAGNNIITGTYQDASALQMEDISRPSFPIEPMTWYDSMIVWRSTAVQFYMRVWSTAGTNAWTLVGTNTQFIGTGVPVYVTRASKNYGSTVARSLFLDLEELYIDVATPKRYLGRELLNF